jgi:hypothetical protein
MALSTFAEKLLFGENPQYGERFYSLWKYCLLYCAGFFSALFKILITLCVGETLPGDDI